MNKQNSAVPPDSPTSSDSASSDFKWGLSRIINLWQSGRTGKICIVILSLVATIVVANSGGEPKEQRELRDAEGSANVGKTSSTNDSEYSSDSHASSTEARVAKIKTVGFWVCNQCGAQIESRIRPTGRCPSRKNAPHGWDKIGEQ